MLLRGRRVAPRTVDLPLLDKASAALGRRDHLPRNADRSAGKGRQFAEECSLLAEVDPGQKLKNPVGGEAQPGMSMGITAWVAGLMDQR